WRSRYRRTLPEYTGVVRPDTAGACGGALRVPTLLSHTFLVDLRSLHPPARDRGLAMATRQSICDDGARHKLYLLRCDTTRLRASGSHPFLAVPGTPSRRYPESNHLPVRGLQPGDTHNYK